jgi:TonB-linked SusC/RagA family outer membrane protein
MISKLMPMKKFIHFNWWTMLFMCSLLTGTYTGMASQTNELAVNSKLFTAQAGIKLSGRVVDKDGFPIPGATVYVKNNPGRGVVTDTEGRYSIDVDSNDILVFSFIGYKTVERVAGTIDKLAIVLEEDVKEMEDVVVVAFGKQKKESVVASISTIEPGKLKVPSSNLTTSFAGQLSGVISYQRSGEPGLDDAEFFIRGITSFGTGKKDPLILIDGIEMTSQDLARINVDDIASFSVMKDANAAALYGARGANGVILVTTKEGKDEKVSLSFRGEVSRSSNSELVEIADPITYMKLHNEAVRTRNALVALPYSTEKIVQTEKGADPVMYPAVDWYNYLIKNSTLNQRYNMSLTGGGKAVKYYLAGSASHDTGILKEDKNNNFDNNIKVNRFQLRSNVNIKLNPTTDAVVRFYGTFDESTGPKQGGAVIFDMARNATPVQFLPYYPKDEANAFTEHTLFGAAESATKYMNPYAQMVSGYKKSSSSMMLSQMELEHRFTNALEGLSVRGIFNLKRDSYYDLQRSFSPFYYAPIPNLDNNEYRLHNFNPDGGTEYLNFDYGARRIISSVYGEGRITYTTSVREKHDVTAMLVGTLRNETRTDVSTLQESLPKRNISLAGRLAYGYNSKYFIEGNFGYNGSERFDKKHRFGFFPSVGLGWMVTNEDFMSLYKDVISKLKLKATYGLVGNDQIGVLADRFFYLSQIIIPDVNHGYTFGEERGYTRPGVTVTRYADPNITWEIAEKLDLGIELGLFDAFEIQTNYFYQLRRNILQTRADIPVTMGLVTTPTSNVGEATGDGFEVSLDYKKSFNKNFWLTAMGNFTYAVGKYRTYEEPDYSDAPWLSREGRKLGQAFGLIAERLFIDQEEVNNSPKQLFGEYGAGDIKYRDINNDGVIDGNDFVPIGFPTTPEIIYGAGISFGLRGFDFSCFFQGSARSSFFIDPSKTTPFVPVSNEYYTNGQRALLKAYADDHWSENNRDLHALWPRLSDYAIVNNNQTSTWWLRNGAFLRLKTAEFGYTLPAEITEKAGIHMARIYVNGSNLFVWSVFDMWDPEMAGNGLGYPLQRVLNIGVNINL